MLRGAEHPSVILPVIRTSHFACQGSVTTRPQGQSTPDGGAGILAQFAKVTQAQLNCLGPLTLDVEVGSGGGSRAIVLGPGAAAKKMDLVGLAPYVGPKVFSYAQLQADVRQVPRSSRA